jgi:hypothetical protein
MKDTLEILVERVSSLSTKPSVGHYENMQKQTLKRLLLLSLQSVFLLLSRQKVLRKMR